jgi:hypothetical protein
MRHANRAGVAPLGTIDAGAAAQAKKRDKMMEGLIRTTRAQEAD